MMGKLNFVDKLKNREKTASSVKVEKMSALKRGMQSILPRAMTSHTYISEGICLTGDLIAEEAIVFDGKMSGNIRSTSHVTIGATAHLDGSIQCDSALVSGHITGRIQADHSLVVKVPATIIGDLISASVQLESGVILQGKIISNPQFKPDTKATLSVAIDEVEELVGHSADQ